MGSSLGAPAYLILITLVLTIAQIYFLYSSYRSFKLNSFIEKSAGIKNLIVGGIIVLVAIYFQIAIETFLSSSKRAPTSDEAFGLTNLKFILYLIIVIGFSGIYVFYKSLQKKP